VNPSLILVFLALFTWGIGEGMFMYFLSIHLQNLGANPVAIGSILSFMGMAMMVSHIPAGFLADRNGRRPLLVTAWSIGIFSTLLMALASRLPLFVTGLLLYGFTAFVSSPLSSYITAARGEWSVSRALSLTSATFNFGAVLGPLTGGWIGGQFGLRWVFAAAAVTFVISTAFLVFIKPQPLDHHDPESPPPSLWNNPRYLGFIALVFAIIFAMYLPQPLTTNFLQSERGLSLQQIGLLGSVAVLGNAVITFVFGSWFSARRGMIAGQVLSAAFALLIWRMTAFPIYALAYFLLGGFRAVRPMLSAQVRGLVHESQMGLAFGMNETVASMALTLAPFAAGLLYDQAPDLVYPVSLGVMALAIFLTLIFSPRGTHA
jgi:DHA1 family multidrug resistance protein-like MFS transporter